MQSILSGDGLARLLDESDLGIVVSDLEGNICSVTPRLLEITGYSEGDLVGAHTRVFKSGQTPSQTYRDLWGQIRTGGTWKGALLNRRKDGKLFLDRETIVGSIDPQGNRACFVAIHRDASIEMDLQLQVSRAGAHLDIQLREVEVVRTQVDSLIKLTALQAEGISHALIAAMEARDANTAGHGLRTCALMDLVGTHLGLFDRFSRESVRLGAILHDIGKIGVPDQILLKPDRLTEVEFEVIKTHPAVGFDILRRAITHEETLRLVRSHHERLDGSGYPDGLRGDEIPDYVKAFSVCDCFDAMTSARSYRRAMAPEDALSILTDDALGGRLDMSAVRVLKQLWKSRALDDVLAIQAAA